MCGRISQVFEQGDITELLGDSVALADNLELEKRYNLGPAQEILCAIANDDELRVGKMHWGDKPKWSSRLVINATWEKCQTQKGYWASWKRCLIPTTSFYEWRRNEDGSRTPHNIHNADNSPMLMAGLWKWSRIKEEKTPVSVVVTMAAEPWMRALHHRQPVLLQPSEAAAWTNGLDPVRIDASDVVLQPVSDHVNKIANEGPSCWV